MGGGWGGRASACVLGCVRAGLTAGQLPLARRRHVPSGCRAVWVSCVPLRFRGVLLLRSVLLRLAALRLLFLPLLLLQNPSRESEGRPKNLRPPRRSQLDPQTEGRRPPNTPRQ